MSIAMSTDEAAVVVVWRAAEQKVIRESALDQPATLTKRDLTVRLTL